MKNNTASISADLSFSMIESEKDSEKKTSQKTLLPRGLGSKRQATPFFL